MIILRCWRTYDGGLVFPGKMVRTWPNETDLGFNKGDPEAWRRFLSQLRINGHLLARRDKNGQRLAYHVRNWGGIKGMSPSDAGKISYFPGRNPDGSKRRIAEHGFLYPPRSPAR